MMSTWPAVLLVAAAILAAFHFGSFYGVALAAAGMLSTLGVTLATDAYGPVADNAGGITTMTALPPEIRERTDALDSLGNTTAATGKGFAIGAAALECQDLQNIGLAVPDVGVGDAIRIDPPAAQVGQIFRGEAGCGAQGRQDRRGDFDHRLLWSGSDGLVDAAEGAVFQGFEHGHVHISIAAQVAGEQADLDQELAVHAQHAAAVAAHRDFRVRF